MTRVALALGLVALASSFGSAACSSSSSSGSSGPRADAAPEGAGGDTSAAMDTGARPDATQTSDTGAGDDGGSQAEIDAAPVPCGPPGGCGPGQACCAASTGGVCAGPDGCGCVTGLQCAYASECPTSGTVCCIGSTMAGCSAGVYQSVCLASCTGISGTQLCNPGVANECHVGMCKTDGKALMAFGLMADAGYGVCQ